MAASPFMDAIYRHMLSHHYGKRTIDSYLYWIRYFIRFHNKRHPKNLGDAEVKAFLSFLASDRNVSVSTQKTALNALAFLYNKYLGKPLGELGFFNKASRPRKLPVVLTRQEVGKLLGRITGSPWLLASMIYASGLRRIFAEPGLLRRLATQCTCPQISISQSQLGHTDVKTTEIYTHVLKRGARGVRSPFSDLQDLHKG